MDGPGQAEGRVVQRRVLRIGYGNGERSRSGLRAPFARSRALTKQDSVDREDRDPRAEGAGKTPEDLHGDVLPATAHVVLDYGPHAELCMQQQRQSKASNGSARAGSFSFSLKAMAYR
jgi:hypothetical protein